MSRAWAWGLALVACSPPATRVPPGRLPAARVTTKSELVLHCEPADAEVVLDGVPQGTCDDFDGEPRGLAMGTGHRRVQVKKRGFLPWETFVETDGTRVMLNVTLISNPGGGTP